MGWGHCDDTYQESVRVKLTFGAMCLCCRHFRGQGTCEAFPRGIPMPILDGRHDHRVKPYALDQGIMWQSVLHAVADPPDDS